MLSRKEDSRPVIQNICQFSVIPSSDPLAERMRSAGIIVINIPMNSTATSSIAPQEKLLSILVCFFVVLNERNAARSMIAISTIVAKLHFTSPSIAIPLLNTSAKLPSVPLNITAPTIHAIKMKLWAPSIRIGSLVSEIGGWHPSAISFLYARVSNTR